MDYKRCWAAVDLAALSHNYHCIRRFLSPGCRYLAIVKADGYGHGAATVAGQLQKDGADWFGVATMEEALDLRRQGIYRPILVLGYTDPAAAPILASNTITQTLFSEEYALQLAAEAAKAGCVVDRHVKIDTGMSRLGFDAENENTVLMVEKLAQSGSLHITGIFTHFAVADEDTPVSRDFTRLQFERFMRVCNRLQADGVNVGLRHCCNSAGTLLHPAYHLDMCRLGLSQYGLDPDPCMKALLDVRPAMSLYTVVSMVKEIPAGATVSYGRQYTAPTPRRIATVAIGYADGYPRSLSNRAEMLLHGKRAPVIGRVCMDQLMLDVTHIPDVEEGDVVTVFGRDGGAFLPVEEVSSLDQTINYETVCQITKRVPRIYRGGKLGGIEKAGRPAR